MVAGRFNARMGNRAGLCVASATLETLMTGDVAMANTYTSLHYHFIFSTKNREPWISPEVEQCIWEYLGGIARQNDMKALQVAGITCGVDGSSVATRRSNPCVPNPGVETPGYHRPPLRGENPKRDLQLRSDW